MTESHSLPASRPPWWRTLNRYHWFVLIVAALGWLFDCLDQQLFNLARVPAMRDLLTPDKNVAQWGGYATSIFLIGWATGGLTFGMLGDRIGRAKTMMFTILIYSLCTGLSALSTGFWDFAFYRFITGLGVGGEFAVGVALVAEVMPKDARPYALGLLQALSAVGNMTAATLTIWLGHLESAGITAKFFGWPAWRWMFVIGALPALLALIIRARLREPERWQRLKEAKKTGSLKVELGSYAELFSNPRWRANAIRGMLLACAGVIGLWGIGFFSIDLLRSIFRKVFEAQGLAGVVLNGKITVWTGIASFMLQLGALFGMFFYGRITQNIGRKPAFAIALCAAFLSTVMVFLFLKPAGLPGEATFASEAACFNRIFWMMPIMGACQLALFAGYAIYFPELFPVHLRSTGVSFCYNVGRFLAATGPTLLGLLTSKVYYNQPEPLRYAGVTMCVIFILGLFVLPFLPETKGKPLPEDEQGSFAH